MSSEAGGNDPITVVGIGASADGPGAPRIGDDGSESVVVVRVVPVEEDDLLLVLFEQADLATVDAPSASTTTDGGAGSAEPHDANRRLESVIEQYESGQQAMRAANEELLSANEELRTTMEDLETSKDKLQSANEELSTLNQENRYKVEELAMLSSDLQNLLVATDIATLFLDRQLRVVRFTPPVARIFNIVPDDRGRPLSDFTNRLQSHDLSVEAQQVLDRLVPVECELRSDDDRWLLTRIIPYRTSDDRIEGVVVTFVDITRRYEAEAALRASEHRLRLALDAAAMGTWWWDPTSETSSGDDRAYEIVGAAAADGAFVNVVSDRLREIDRGHWWAFVRSGEDSDLEFRAATIAGAVVDIQVNVRDDASAPAGRDASRATRTGTIRDVTSRVQAMESLADRTKRLTLLAQAAAHLLRGSEPETVLGELFDEMAATLGLEIYEQFEYGEDASPCSVGGNVTWATPEPGEKGGAHVGLGTCSLAFERCEPVIYDGVVHFPDDSQAAVEREGLQAYGCFPLVANGQVFGALCFGTRGEARFDEATVELIRTIVDYLAVGEQRLRTEAELRELNRSLESRIDDATRDLRASETQLRHVASDLVRAEQSERQRIAQLLHDDLQQLLFGAQMRVGLMRDDLVAELAGSGDERIAGHLDEAERYIGESIAIARHLTAELVPPALDDDDLGETVRWLVDQMRELHDLDVEVNIGTGLHVPDRETRVIVHQTIRELLFNVVKHAGVGHARVDLAVHDDEVEIHVADGGSGFDTDQVFADPTRSGRGLATLRQRLVLVGGGLHLESIPGDGTSAHVRLPATSVDRHG